MTTNRWVLVAFILSTVIGIVLWMLNQHSREYGPAVGGLALGVIYAGIIWKLAKVLDAEQKRKRDLELKAYNERHT